ncbi:aldehyde dehydrogenase (NADP(+)) [Pelobacter seleniigenes]|uniref:aldehyde dehydrogenase (NADP(+)) n=1 Tax=Pelobacter seleniigenes TaxID=407188 RepID=UPI0004A76655|nr:aldehyde dehydrogenase (NADP(+)) [Pelobacter seleniigenes]
MSITGKLLINGEWVTGQSGTYQAVNPASGAKLEPILSKASSAQVDAAVAAAAACAAEFRRCSLAKRAEFLRACATEIMALGDELVQRAIAETGLPQGRIEGERGRTCFQLNMFADVVEAGDFLDVRIDTALPDRQPLPRPDLRYMNQAIGPVVVFGASNFPLAFSVAGGDTASAFAAGCPVLVKGHSSHPGTSELMAQAIDKAIKQTGLPAGVFSLLMGAGREVGSALVVAPEVKAVGFTGSFSGGMTLVKLANDRPEPIPVFTEMGSQNPVILLPKKLASEAEQVAEGFVTSLNMGVGQFCTNPGLVLGIAGPELDRFIKAAEECLAKQPAGVMLNQGIQEAYNEGVATISSQPGVTCNAVGESHQGKTGFCGQPTLLTVSASDFIANTALTEEMFGPASLLVTCKDLAELEAVVTSLKGQLTGTIQTAPGEMSEYPELIDLLNTRVGRLLVNGYPTGVEVCHAMVHGGPFPAASDVRFTSVGSAAIYRFLRPICLQNYPPELFPEPLQNSNPLNIWRLVNGSRTRDAI